jgi:hypothetical protein
MSINGLRRSALPVVTIAVIAAAISSCSSNDEAGAPTPSPKSEQRWPDVIDVAVRRAGNAYDFDVTISSPYDSPDRYADGWRIKDADGSVFGEHELLHDHATEQPFTRTQTGVEIPEGVTKVIVEGRDTEFGYGGETMTVSLP